MTLLVIIFLVGIGIPTIVALCVSWRETSLRTVRAVRHAPKSRSAATIVIYHADNQGTRTTLRSLRRFRSVQLKIIVVVPANTTFNQPAFANVQVYRKQRPASRELTIASCYNLIDPSHPLCILDSGAIMTARILYTGLGVFRRSTLQWIVCRHHTPTEATFSSIMQWYAQALQHVENIFRRHLPQLLPAGLWLRYGSQLRSKALVSGNYLPNVEIKSVTNPQPGGLSAPGIIASAILLAVAIPCYVAAMQLQAALPLIVFWIICAWWFNVLISLAPGRTSTKLLPAVCAPLGGILLPAWCTLQIGLVLLRAGQRLARTRRQHTEHRALFRLRHP